MIALNVEINICIDLEKFTDFFHKIMSLCRTNRGSVWVRRVVPLGYGVVSQVWPGTVLWGHGGWGICSVLWHSQKVGFMLLIV